MDGWMDGQKEWREEARADQKKNHQEDSKSCCPLLHTFIGWAKASCKAGSAGQLSVGKIRLLLPRKTYIDSGGRVSAALLWLKHNFRGWALRLRRALKTEGALGCVRGRVVSCRVSLNSSPGTTKNKKQKNHTDTLIKQSLAKYNRTTRNRNTN